MFDIQNYYKAQSVLEAVNILQANPGARLIAGGTDVLVKLRHYDKKYQCLVDIHNLAELEECSLNGARLFIGAGLTFSKIMASELVKKYVPVLAEASAVVAGPQIRNMGTVGGNIANGATSADMAGPMLILEPALVIQGPGGLRRASVIGFHAGPAQVALGKDEILTGFEFDLEELRGLGSAYYKYAMRSAMDIATIGCAAGIKIKNGLISDLRLAFTVAAPTPIRCGNAEAAALAQPLNEATLQKITKALDDDVKPRASWRASREFRTRIIKTLAERMIKAASEKLSSKGEK